MNAHTAAFELEDKREDEAHNFVIVSELKLQDYQHGYRDEMLKNIVLDSFETFDEEEAELIAEMWKAKECGHKYALIEAANKLLGFLDAGVGCAIAHEMTEGES